jgi:quinohemoprotein ethanol dehydrogenase
MKVSGSRYPFFFMRFITGFKTELLLYLCMVFLCFSCKNSEQKNLLQDQQIANELETSDWLAYGRTHSEQRFSPLAAINDSTVSGLKVDWYLDLPNDIGLVSTPLVINGVLYFSGTMNIVRAVDAVTGKLIWEHDPEVGKHVGNRKKAGWSHNRGLSYYNGKLFTTTWDGRLQALDLKTGRLIWSAQTFDPDKALTITGAPKAFKGKVLIGNGGSEKGPSRGYVTAYDTERGQQAWRFYIVPGNPADGFENEAMKMAAETWTGEWWKLGGGGNAWHGFTYDPELDLVYIGTGNGGPWNRKIRSPGGGDNLFLCSIVALDPDNGEYRWHYQTTPGESWDYNSNMDIVLAELMIGESEGKKTKVILHAPKNGFFYVINRETGKLISAEPFVETSWASHIDLKTGRPVERVNSRYDTGKFYLTPSPHGAHSWHAMSFNPMTGLVYLPTIHDASFYSDEGIDKANFKSIEFKGGIGVRLTSPDTLPRPYSGSLQAWDPVKQKQVWSIPQKELWNAGTLTTAGNLVFQGQADGKFCAYNATNGELLWTFDCGLGISAPPITYSLNGRQYISLLVGWGGAFAGVGNKALGWEYGKHMRRLITFSLEGKAGLPKQPPPYYPVPLEAPDFK